MFKKCNKMSTAFVCVDLFADVLDKCNNFMFIEIERSLNGMQPLQLLARFWLSKPFQP